ncbi:hypothetical protein [Pedobacter sp. GR22-6]|uniref:hypothetical protein n=1 Tax=Pedobacter sp. GR22-6 TaxID=3127957 RepID=UPI00307CFA6A
MKKLSLMTITTLSLFFAACGSDKTDQRSADTTQSSVSDSTTSTDSLATPIDTAIGRGANTGTPAATVDTIGN